MANKLKRVVFAATGRELHIDVPLSNLAIDYTPAEMIADQLCPTVPVPNLSGQIPIFSRGDLLRSDNDLRAPGTEANKVHRNVSSDSFLCKNRALKTDVTLEDRNNSDPIYVQKLYNGAATFLKTKLLINKESRVALTVTSGSNVGSYSACGSSWTDHTNSDPLSDVQTMLDNVQDLTGKRPNKVVMGVQAWRHFRRNDTVRNLIFGTNNGGGFPSRDQAANLLDVGQVLVGETYENTGAEGQSEDLSSIWADHVFAEYVPGAPSIFEPSFMYEFRWTQAGIPNMQAERHPYNPKTKSEEIELGFYTEDQKVTGADYGFLLTNCTSST